MTDRVIQAMAGVPEVCEGLHLPVQSGSTPMLRKMLRNYTREGYLDLVRRLRDAMPDLTLSTDLIVGYPGETEDDFRQTLSLIEEIQFDWAFVFKYSARKGTPAAELEGFPEELIEERHQECLALTESVGAARRARLAGTTQEVLIDAEGFGRTRGNHKVSVEGSTSVGQIVRVRITNAEKVTLEGLQID
jgi:tRNA-2-methylthio-N6-dimethylallyladenosine synthase